MYSLTIQASDSSHCYWIQAVCNGFMSAMKQKTSDIHIHNCYTKNANEIGPDNWCWMKRENERGRKSADIECGKRWHCLWVWYQWLLPKTMIPMNVCADLFLFSSSRLAFRPTFRPVRISLVSILSAQYKHENNRINLLFFFQPVNALSCLVPLSSWHIYIWLCYVFSFFAV